MGYAIRDARSSRHLTQRALADDAAVGRSTLQQIEQGAFGGLETYVAIARALRLRVDLELVDPRRRASPRAEDPVHAAMGEALAERFRGLGFGVGVDEPYQHFQFAGRVDLAMWSRQPPALLSIENRTRFPNLGETAGAFNAKCAYFGGEFAERLGFERWASETHVVVALWSSEALHAIRRHRATFAALCPSSDAAWREWWDGRPPPTGHHRCLVVFDPLAGRRRDRARWIAGDSIETARPRYRDYADAADAIRTARN